MPKTILAPRASSILYDVLRTRRLGETFLVPANICPIVPAVFAKAGMLVEFVDIDSTSLEMDLDAAEARLRKGGLGGVLYAHTYGDRETPRDFFELVKNSSEPLLLIDDRCLCAPGLEPPPDMLADVCLYSTGYGKIVDLGAMGYAFIDADVKITHHSLPFRPADLGALNRDLKSAITGRRKFVYHESDWLQTDGEVTTWSALLARLRPALAATMAHRRSINAVYNRVIPKEIRLPDRFQLWRYNVRVARKAALLEAIFGAGLFASSHYASLVDIMGPGNGKNAQDLSKSVVNLFNDSHYTVSMAEKTAQILLEIL